MAKNCQILENHFNGMTQRAVEVTVRNFRHTNRHIVNKSKKVIKRNY